MDYTKLVKDIVDSITSEDVEVKEEDNSIKIISPDSSYGKIIGKSGNTINAIRTLVDEAASIHGDSFIKVEVEKKEN